MMRILVIGLGAGAAAALLFASVSSGTLLSVALFYLAPLPIMIAALGWSHWAGLVAAAVATAVLAGALGSIASLIFLGTIGAPAWWLGYLALLGRTVADPGGTHVEWYPVERLVLRAAVLGAALVACALMSFGADGDAITAGLAGMLDRFFRLQMGLSADEPLRFPGLDHADRLIGFMVAVLPPAAAIVGTLTQIGNLWLAGRIVKVSGRLPRPWPDLSALSFPPMAAAVFVAAIAATFVAGFAGVMASLLTATLAIAFALAGFAVLHTLTRGMRARSLLLSSTYVIVGLFGWPVLLMTLIGLVETLFGLRRRLPVRPAEIPKSDHSP
jgi:hypothetical protein